MKTGIFLGTERPHADAILISVRLSPPFPEDRSSKPTPQASVFAARVDEDDEYCLIELSPEERDSIAKAVMSANINADQWYWSIFIND